MVVITADAVLGGRGGHGENCFMAFKYYKKLNYMSSNCIINKLIITLW